jgi:hypothetical protein
LGRTKTNILHGIFNLITGDFYIGSAITNRFYSRFYKHLIKGLGNKYIYYSVNKYKLENFAFVILEYFPFHFLLFSFSLFIQD